LTVKNYLIMSITCPDRPGLVERITEVIVAHSANWEESRMTRLEGDFAGIVKIGVARENLERLAESLRALGNEDMTVTVKVAHRAPQVDINKTQFCHLRVVGADHEGIVHEVARYLAKAGINVEAMETGMVPAPMSAAPLFQMEAQIRIPPGIQLEELSANLERIGDELGVDVDLSRSAEGNS
jgi:glycine cleavage system regulatory protein